MKILQVVQDNLNDFSVRIKDKDITLWVDVWKQNNEFEVDWNQYIFRTDNSIDMAVKAYQENNENCDECFSLAMYGVEQLISEQKI